PAAPLADLAEARREVARLKARLLEVERAAAPEAPPPAPVEEAPPAPAPAPEPPPAAAVPAARRLHVESARSLLASGDLKHGKGLDIGTVNLVAAEQNDQGEVVLRLRRNAFIDVEITPYTKNMLTQLKVPYVVQGKRMYVLGDEAFELANVLNRNTRRPMKDGLISPKEQDALPVMKLLIGSILGEPRVPNEVCFYSVPGDPVDMDLSVAYHRDLFDAVLKALGYKPSHIIEGHAVVFAELADEDFTGIGISCGGGMFNICVAYKSMPALTFSTARSGDWVDFNVAQALGITPVKAALLKEKGVDLMSPRTREEDAIAIYYRNLIKYNLTNIAERFRAAENMPSFPDPISIVFSGGTAMAGNFIELVKAVFKELDFPIPVKDIRLARDPLHATAKGALAAAMLEMAGQPA
ncbi:MAG TPA: cell division protein FtsA, partial [Planctomycetota bacterium]|nr:cell division protein FtsA [Planctomycetota bacterium]